MKSINIKIFATLIFLNFFQYQHAKCQNTYQAIIKNSETGEKLVGATAVLEGTTNAASSDFNGLLILNNIPNGKQTIIFSFIGYEKIEKSYIFPLKDSIQYIYLNQDGEKIEQIIVSSTRVDSRIENVPVRIEVIGNEEVTEEANIKPTNISKLLLESTGIQAQQTSAVTGNMSLRLQGLDGKYTQILKDGFPLYGGFSQELSILQIPPLDLKQVEIIKGSSSSLYGSDAIAGIVNLISKKPQNKPEFDVLLNQTSLMGTDADVYYSKLWKKLGFTILSANSFQKLKDVNSDGFSDLPQSNTFNFSPAFYYNFDSLATVFFKINSSFDNRKGGDTFVIKGLSDSVHKFFEENKSKRFSTQFKFEKKFKNNSVLTFKNSFAYFISELRTSNYSFKGSQYSSFTELSYSKKMANNQFVGGLNFISEKFNEDSTFSHFRRNYDYKTFGIFAQDDWHFVNFLSLQAGLRTDYQNKFGFLVLPRLSMMLKFSENFYIRAGSGFGYKLPTIFSNNSFNENNNDFLVLDKNAKPEKSIGAGIDFNFKIKIEDQGSISFNQSFYYTKINNPLILQLFSFENTTQPLISKGFESNFRFTEDEFQLFIGYAFVDSRRLYDSLQTFAPLTPKHKINLDIIYEKENNFSVAFEGYYISSMYRDFDTKTKPYFTVGLIFQKYFKHFTIILNCENLTDVRQTRFENIIIQPTENPTFREIYAPLDGRVFSAAVRFNL